jgi:hypothetical protein
VNKITEQLVLLIKVTSPCCNASQEAKFKLAIFYFYCIVCTTSSQNKKYPCKNNFYEKKIILSRSIYFYCIVHTNSSLLKNYISKNICYQNKKIDLVPFIFIVYYLLLLERKVSFVKK